MVSLDFREIEAEEMVLNGRRRRLIDLHTQFHYEVTAFSQSQKLTIEVGDSATRSCHCEGSYKLCNRWQDMLIGDTMQCK